MIHIDAHCDTSGPCEGRKFHHGGPFRQAVLDGVLDPTKTIRIGVRGGAEYLWEFSRDSGMPVLHVEEVMSLGMARVIQTARDVVEVAPQYDPTSNTAQAAAQILFIQLCLATTAIQQRKLA